MSKRVKDIPLGNSEKKKKRKHLSLSIAQKVELLQKLDAGVTVRCLTEEYGVGTTTIYDLKKQKDKLLKFYSDSDNHELMKNRKTLHRAKNEDLDRVLIEWIQQRRSKDMPLTSLLVMKQARIYHEELNIESECEYSEGWLQKFKKRHGIKYLKMCSGKASTDCETAENYIDEFAKIISDENLSPEQIYNADETALYWCYVPRKTLTMANERAPTDFRDAKQRLTVLGCANAAGTHKIKLAVIGQSLHPSYLKDVSSLPVHYYANKKATVTRAIFSDWFNKHFVPAARIHCKKAGLGGNCKILLFLDSCSAHPPPELLVKSNVFSIYLPHNVTSLIQPCNQGILRSLKSKYKHFFLNSMLASVNRGLKIQDFLKEFSLKDAIYAVANAWNDVDKSTLTKAWHRLWATMMFENDLTDEDFEGFRDSNEKMMISKLITYAKSLSAESVNKLEEADIEEMLNIDNDAPVVHPLYEGEIAEIGLYTDHHEDSSSNDDGIVSTGEKIPTDQMIKMCDQLIAGLKQCALISEQEIMALYSIKEKLLRQKPVLRKQMTLGKVF
ncbi:tigger transposable element-derived protein 2-like [Nannospalax galili]|uniref:Tigger transposable element-derived protein 2-like n=1 Tax=Nannospalax galili TaxID=1026970 RepID=A0A8C6R3T4_NANGA|nr:tigger transposable element-derived protein 2-like [Nannospalax galili]XP_029410190.1 tigger transposable element-derived protein 2-like [Nannospalax galili]XP_029410191.1 tigger transposable element-derived protein 2-like [Nannospalax galili]XP_029410193.1 tigger transposable element-derived protein 2-like [Nannospalax galili]